VSMLLTKPETSYYILLKCMPDAPMPRTNPLTLTEPRYAYTPITNQCAFDTYLYEQRYSSIRSLYTTPTLFLAIRMVKNTNTQRETHSVKSHKTKY
jgi:hypothetical protein